MKEVKFRMWDKDLERFIPDNVYAIFPNRADFGAIAVMITDWMDYRKGEYFYPDKYRFEMFDGNSWNEVEMVY